MLLVALEIGLLLVTKFNNKITIQWIKAYCSQIDSGYYDEKVINLPITYNQNHFFSIVGHGTRVAVLLTTLGKQLSYTRVGTYNWSKVVQSADVNIISIGI